jgi:cell division septal protein FtsQ
MKASAPKKEIVNLTTLRRRRKKIKTIVVIASCLCAIVLLVLATRLDVLRIKNIKIVSVFSGDKIQELIAKEISGKYLALIPKNNTLFFPASAISAIVSKEFIPVESVEISRDGLNGLVVNVTERVTYFHWCGVSPDLVQDCYSVDKGGLVFKKADSNEVDQVVKLFAPISKIALDTNKIIGISLLSNSEFDALISLVDSAKKVGVNFVSIVIDQSGIVLYAAGGWEIKAPLGDKLQNASQIFDVTVNSKAFAREGSFEDLEYIDLRYGNKVYYKHK